MKDEVTIQFGDTRGGVMSIELGDGRVVPLLDGRTGEPVWFQAGATARDRTRGYGPTFDIAERLRGRGLRTLN